MIKVKFVAIDIEFNKIFAYTPFHFSRTLPLSLTVVKSYSTAIYITLYKLIDLSKNSLKNQKLIKWDQNLDSIFYPNRPVVFLQALQKSGWPDTRVNRKPKQDAPFYKSVLLNSRSWKTSGDWNPKPNLSLAAYLPGFTK